MMGNISCILALVNECTFINLATLKKPLFMVKFNWLGRHTNGGTVRWQVPNYDGAGLDYRSLTNGNPLNDRSISTYRDGVM